MMIGLATPEVAIAVLILLVLVVESFRRESQRSITAWTAMAGLSLVFVLLLFSSGMKPPTFLAESFGYSNFQWIFKVLVTATGMGSVLLVIDYFRRETQHAGSVSLLMLFSILGMYILISSTNLLVLYLGLEMMTFPIYLAVSMGRGVRDGASLEASVKYFVMGGVASALFLFGASLIFAAGGTFVISDVSGFAVNAASQKLVMSGLLLMGITAFFKLSVFPFHFWAPDAYEGASAPVTGFMATAVKTAAFVFLLKIIYTLTGGLGAMWFGLVAVLSIVTMTWGNWMALFQQNLNRLFAYSSIAHVGYMLIAVSLVRHDPQSGWGGPVASLIIYLTAYTAMTLGAFAVISACRIRTVDQVRGLSRRSPFAAALLALFLLSLTGIPPTAGFMGKFHIFMDAVRFNQVGLAIAGALNSAIAAFYYLRIIKAAYLEEGEADKAPFSLSIPALSVVVCAGVVVIGLGLWPACRDFVSHLI
jgi:NADH-quinone oxidoreductase subunit N